MKFPGVKRRRALVLLVIFLSGLDISFCRAANVVTADVCIYGGTSGGAIAAVAAARLGKSVSLVMVNNHVGGMTSGGLSVTDVGNAATIGGFATEFYSRVGQAYGSTNPVYWFEPHVAEQVFLQMLDAAGVTIYPNQQLASVTSSNLVITQITMADGTVYRAQEFIDATYEGDLMALAGVSCTYGRESSSTYGESLAGVQVNSVAYPCDPYVIPGNAASGLLPLIQSGSPAATGSGDTKIQTYNFRLCLTQVITNQIPITAPANYSEATYELLHRYINAYAAANGSVPLNRLIDVQQLIPNGKTDINAYADISTDFIGYNYTYPTNDYLGRQLTYQQHKDYLAGMLYYLATSTNVPLNVRTNMQSWGYAKDEFQDNGGWPYALYVREARRMIGDYVMQQQDAQGIRAAPDSIALASYTLDCHPVARLAVNGVSTTEGGIGTTVQYPYPVSYRAIVPKVGECQNLFCTFALSASHVGFASVRLEPVFMMTSQSAGTAAAFAIDDHVPVQSVSYQKLAAQLLADGQLLTWSSGQSVSTNGIILTVNNTVGVTASSGWTTGANPGGWPLPDGSYWHDGNTGKGTKFVRFTPTLTTNGYYDVYLWWVTDPNRATNAPVDIISGIISNRVYINQTLNGSAWVKVASSNYFSLGTNSSVTIRNNDTTGYVVANAVRWLPLGNIAPNPPAPIPTIQIVASDATAGEFGTNPARFTVVCPNGTNATPLTVNYSVGGTAVPGMDYFALPGTVTVPAGVLAANIFVAPTGNHLNTNQVSVALNLLPSADYTLADLTNATAVIFDYPLDDWWRANFTPAELANASVSGDAANPSRDGLPNLMKYALGLSPTATNANPFLPAFTNGIFTVTYPLADDAVDVTVIPEWSTNLVSWVNGPNYILPIQLADDGTNRTILLHAAAPATSGYFRFRVSRP